MVTAEPGLVVRATDLIARRVVTLGGESDSEVKDVVFDRTAGALTGFTLRATGLLGGPRHDVLPMRGVESVGPDAVMVVDGRSFTRSENLAGGGDQVLGDAVMTDTGRRLGTVVDVVIELHGGEGDIIGFELEPDGDADMGDGLVFVPLPDALSLSDEAVVVPAVACDHVTGDLDELRRCTAELRSVERA